MTEDIKQNILKYVLDSSYKTNSISISYSLINDKYFLLHIYNPNEDKIFLNKNNNVFFKKVCDMLFNQTEKQKGCFNHQHDDNSYVYKMDLSDLVNYFLKIEYSFIMVDIKTFEPISICCLVHNYIYNVCTNYHYRNQGKMEQLLNHLFKLIKMNKLKNGFHSEILLDIVFKNPQYKSVREFYEKNYGFNFLRENDKKTILKKVI
jgi:hypothetical protein